MVTYRGRFKHNLIDPIHSDHYELGLIHGTFYGAFLLILFNCGSSLHPGVSRDWPVEALDGGLLVPFIYTNYYYIKARDY